MWALQGFILPRRVRIMYGSRTYNFLATKRVDTEPDTFDPVLRSIGNHGIDISAKRGCPYQHNRVYALYGTVAGLQALYPVDYGKSLSQVMLETTVFIFRKAYCGPLYQCLLVLANCDGPPFLMRSDLQ